MEVYLNDHIEQLDVEKELPLVSEQRRQEALRYLQERDRRLSLAVYQLLQEALKKEYGIIDPPQFSFGANGKPMLVDFPQIHFNLSHCNLAALCVVDKYPVGCDIEVVPEILDLDLCHYCFNDKETDAILSAPHPTIAFTEQWTKKEAFLKLTGEGLTDTLPTILDTPLAQSVSFYTHVATNQSFVYTICSQNLPHDILESKK